MARETLGARAVSPSTGAEKAWYLWEPMRTRRLGLLLTMPPIALLQFWVQTAHNDGSGRGLDGGAAITAYFIFAGIIRGLTAPHEPAVAVIASGLFNGAEFYRWEQIGDLQMEDEETILATVDGKRRFLELPDSEVRGADIYSLINYYLVRPGARAGIAQAEWPAIVSYGPVRHP